MPRKYEKKTKGNIRGGRRGSRRASMRLSMIPPGFSMMNDEYDREVDDTLLFLKAKGMDRERERFAEALAEVRDRISKIIEDYDGGLEETSQIYRDYIDELEDQASRMPGGKLRQNIFRILADYKIVCDEREELLIAINKSFSRVRPMVVVGNYDDDYDEEDEINFFDIESNLRNYTKTVHWLSNKFKDMDARVHLLKKQEVVGKTERKSKKQGKQKSNAKSTENASEKPEAKDSRERLETWKNAADEIVELLRSVRQENEGAKDVLESRLQEIMNIMSKQNEEIVKGKEIIKEEKEANAKLKISHEKVQVQLRSQENTLKKKREEVTKCKQYIEEITKKLKETKGGITFSFGDEGNDFTDELSTVMRRRFTLTETSKNSEDILQLQLKDARRKTIDLEEEKLKLEEDMTKLSAALVQKETDLSELKTLFTGGEGTYCPKCISLAATPASEDGRKTEDESEVEVLEKKLKESESKLQSTVVELARMKIKLASAGESVMCYEDIGTQTLPTFKKAKRENREECTESSSHTDLEEDVTDSVMAIQSSQGRRLTIERSPLKTPGVKDTDDTNKLKYIKSTVISEGQRNSVTEEDTIDGEVVERLSPSSSADVTFVQGNSNLAEYYDSEEDEYSTAQSAARSTSTPAPKMTMEHKAVQTIQGEWNIEKDFLVTRSSRSHDGTRSKMYKMDAQERLVHDIQQGIGSVLKGAEEIDYGETWRNQLQRLADDIEDVLVKSKEVNKEYFTDDNDRFDKMPSDLSEITKEESEELCTDEQQFMKTRARRRTKSIFERLLENNNKKTRGQFKNRRTGASHQRTGGSKRRTIEVDMSVGSQTTAGGAEEQKIVKLPRLPVLTARRPKLSSKHPESTISRRNASIQPAASVKQPTETSSSIKIPTESTISRENSPIQPPTSVKQSTETSSSITTPSQATETSSPSTPKQPQDIANQPAETPPRAIHSLIFPGEDAASSEMKTAQSNVGAPYSKPFKVRRRSIFGHTDIMEKMNMGNTMSDDAAISSVKRLLGETPFPSDAENYYEVETKDNWRAVCTPEKSQGRRYSSNSPGIFNQDIEGHQTKHFPRINRGIYRPSLHTFLGMSPEERKRVAEADNARHRMSGIYEPHNYIDDDEDTEIEVGSLMNNMPMTSLRTNFLKLGLMHLRGNEDNIRPDERLTMEDQINIIAQTAMEAMKRTCFLFAQRNEQPPEPHSPQYAEDHDGVEEQVVMSPPANSPETRNPSETKFDGKFSEENKKTSFPDLVKPEASPKPIVPDSLQKKVRKASKDSELRSKEMYSQFAKRRSLFRQFGHGRNVQHPRRSVMEKILGRQFNAFAGFHGQDNSSRFGAIRNYNTPYLRRDTTGMDAFDKFSITAQAIKVPRTEQRLPSVRPREGMKKSTSIPAHGLSLASRLKHVPAISKAKSDQTHNRLLIQAGGLEHRNPLSKVRQTGVQKGSTFK